MNIMSDDDSDDSSSGIYSYSPKVDKYDYKLNIVMTDFSKSILQESGILAEFVTSDEDDYFLERYDILLYANGWNMENRGYISVLFLENKNSHLNSDCVTFTFSCILSVIDNAGQSRFPQSFAVRRCAGVEETSGKDPFTPFGLERFVKCMTVTNSAEEFLSDDKLTIQLDAIVSERFKVDSYYSANIFKAMSCDDSIETIQEPDGSTKYKLAFGTPLFYYLQYESPYFQRIAETPMSEATNKSMFICNDEYPAFCKLEKFVAVGTLRHIESVDEFIDLHRIADKYGLIRVKESCADHLKNHLTTENATDILISAELHNDQTLMTTVIHYIRSFQSDVTSTDGWTHLVNMKPELARQIFIDDKEVEITSIRGNKTNESNKNTEDSSNKSEDSKNLEIPSYLN